MAHLSIVTPDRSAAGRASQLIERTTSGGHAGVPFHDRPTTDPLRHLQDRAAPRRRLDDTRAGRRVSPHTVRHTAAVHLLEGGVEVNVIRAWLGYADLTTTNRYAEITTKAKIEALRNTEPAGASEGPRPRAIWRSDQAPLDWLSSF